MIKYKIKNQLDIKKIALATAKRVQSPTIVPRVVINLFLDEFIANTFGAIFLCKTMLKRENFKRFVHQKNYDLGVYFFNDNGDIYAEIIDGNGCMASKRTQSIFNDFMLKNESDITDAEKTLKKQYQKLKKSKLFADTNF